MKKISPAILLILFVLLNGPLSGQSVWTQHNDQGRTGWYPYETNLTTNNINTNTFGLAFSQTVDDKILAQPLVIMKVNIPGFGLKNVVYAATLNNSVYAFDADVSGNAYWQKNYTNKISSAGADCTNCRPAVSSDIHPSLCGGTYGDFKGNMGICTTPVIDTAAGTMFFVTKIVNFNDGILDNHSYRLGIKDEYNYTTTCFHQYLHAIDITTGNERPNSPVEITGTLNGAGDGQTTPGRITFDPRRQFSRPGLVLSNGSVYISFASHCDNNPSHGWVISYNASTLVQNHAYISTPNDGRGGIWMSGTAPAVDESGNLYLAAGNSLDEDRTSSEYNTYSALPSNSVNRGEGVIKLAPDLTISSYFTPFNYISLDDADLDFPTQVMIVPNTSLAVTACKDGNIYVMDKTSLGGYSTTKNNILQTVFNGGGGSFHSSFAYFGGQTTQYFYTYPENVSLKAYPVTASGLGTPTVNNSMPSPSGSQGGYMSVSSNGTDPATGVLWAYQAINGCDANQSNCRGILHALSANNIANELWNSEMIATDKLTVFNKFLCPTIALGKVYIGGNTNQLVVYGLKTNTSCLTNAAVGKTAVALTSVSGSPASNAIDGTTGTKWTSTAHDVDSIYVDLGAIYNICKIAVNWDPAGYGKDFDLKISLDGINWTTVSSVRGNSAIYNESNGTVSARFVNMRGITRGTANGYSITEFQVFGSPSNFTCPAPTGLNASPTSVTTIFTNQTPVASTDNDGQGFNAGLKFQSSVAGNIIGLRFYKTPGNTGTHLAALYNSTGTQLATLTFAGETSTGWQSANFSSPVAITANKTYTAVYFNASGYYTEDNDYFANSGVTNGPLTALKDGTDGCNGPYDYGTSMARPVSCFKSANYWIDVMLSNGSSSNSELLSWNAIPGASQYLIKYRPNNSVSWITRTSNTNSITISALTCGSQYYYTVQSVCGTSQGAVSQSSFTATPCSGGPTCDNLLTRFFSVDLGDIGAAGSTCRNGAVYTINGSGTDIGGSGDQFQFVYTNGNDIGDYDVYGRITAQTAANAASKVGIMVRDSLTNTSRFAYMAYESGKMIFVNRDQPSSPAITINIAGSFTLPYYVKISKSGTTYSAFISPDGIGWTTVGSKNLNFGTDITNTPHYGMAVTSADNTKLSTGIMDGFTLVTAGSGTVIANAGTNQTITLPNSSVTLDGSGSSGTITSYAWTKISGPNTPVITTPTAVSTTVTGLIAGSYVFQLSLNAGVSTAQVTIIVNSAAAPIANAGSNQTITLPTSSVTLNGSGSTGTITDYTWTKVSGPGTPVITTPTAVSTTVTGLVAGVYVFQLSINSGTSTSQVTITVNAAGTGSTIFTNQIPVAATDNDHNATVGQELGVKFSSSVAGNITGIRFYKTSGNSGTHIGELYSAAGARLAQATFTNETATGWQTVLFSSPVAITAGTTYTAAYFSSLGYYTEDNNYFLNHSVTNSPLTAAADGTNGASGTDPGTGQGTYKYTATPAFPNQLYRSANYWVDVVFSSGSSAPTANAGSNQTITLPVSTVTL